MVYRNLIIGDKKISKTTVATNTLPWRYYHVTEHLGVSLAKWSLLVHMGFHVLHAIVSKMRKEKDKQEESTLHEECTSAHVRGNTSKLKLKVSFITIKQLPLYTRYLRLYRSTTTLKTNAQSRKKKLEKKYKIFPTDPNNNEILLITNYSKKILPK